MSGDFSAVYSRSLKDPEAFWAEAAESIHWEKRWDTVLDASNPPYILVTSEIVGEPDSMVRSNRGPAVAPKWPMKNIHGVGMGWRLLSGILLTIVRPRGTGSAVASGGRRCHRPGPRFIV